MDEWINECANAHSIRGPGFESRLAALPPDLNTTASNYGTCQEQSGGPMYAYAFVGCWQMTTGCITGAGGASINSRMAMDEAGMFVLDGMPLHSLVCGLP
jgi:hypothetical protein